MDTQLIEAIRKRKEITQVVFAESIDMTVTGYQKMIRNGDIKVSTLEKIAEKYGIQMSTFFGTPTKVNNMENVIFELESSDILKINLKNQTLEITKK